MYEEQTKYLFKELDFIDSSISRLDNRIQKSKHFCILLWLGVIGFLVSDSFTDIPSFTIKKALFATALFPAIFGIMDFYWRRALMTVSWRQHMISLYLNNRAEIAQLDSTVFPVLDPTGENYEENHYPQFIINLDQYKTKPTKREAIFYKDAKWFFPTMMIFSIIVGALYK